MMAATSWETIAKKLKAAGWRVRWEWKEDKSGKLFWHVNAEQDGRKFLAHAEVLDVALLEIERMIAE